VDLMIPFQKFNYKASLIYNNENIRPGENCIILLQSKLYQNDKLISLGVLKDTKVTVDMTTADEQIITKKFENVVLGYDRDYPISFILPSKVVRVNVSVKAKVFRLMGSYEDLGYNQEIRIENIADSGRFKSVYLDYRAAKGYFVKVMGKNGEPMPNETVKLVLSQRFLDGDFLTKSCVSDANGEVALGALPQVGTVSVNHQDINYSFDTCMTDSLQDSQHMSDTYQIVIGEPLKLPN
jgi:hypothetical protein